MDFTGVYHKASEQMCYPLNEDELIVNLKTGYDVKRVFIYYGDPFEAGILGGKEQWAGKKEEICFKKHLRHHLWWTTTLTPRFKRCKLPSLIGASPAVSAIALLQLTRDINSRP